MRKHSACNRPRQDDRRHPQSDWHGPCPRKPTARSRLMQSVQRRNFSCSADAPSLLNASENIRSTAYQRFIGPEWRSMKTSGRSRQNQTIRIINRACRNVRAPPANDQASRNYILIIEISHTLLNIIQHYQSQGFKGPFRENSISDCRASAAGVGLGKPQRSSR
jgi:hypothetical protein